ncbi:MAG: hypothetical protein ACI4M6_00135 [Christensenellaceae bacterium]
MDTKDIIEEELGNDSVSADNSLSSVSGNDGDWSDINENDSFTDQAENDSEQGSFTLQPAPTEKKSKAEKKKQKKVAESQQAGFKAENNSVDESSKTKRNKSNAYPVSFINMFLHQILFFFPILGFFFIFISLINRKANKNIKTMALTAIIWQFVFIGIFAFFLFNKGIGYILGWMEEEMGWIKAVQ